MEKDINTLLFKFPFTIPSYFGLMGRAVSMLEGIALKGDPKFDIWTATYPLA